MKDRKGKRDRETEKDRITEGYIIYIDKKKEKKITGMRNKG